MAAKNHHSCTFFSFPSLQTEVALVLRFCMTFFLSPAGELLVIIDKKTHCAGDVYRGRIEQREKKKGALPRGRLLSQVQVQSTRHLPQLDLISQDWCRPRRVLENPPAPLLPDCPKRHHRNGGRPLAVRRCTNQMPRPARRVRQFVRAKEGGEREKEREQRSGLRGSG